MNIDEIYAGGGNYLNFERVDSLKLWGKTLRISAEVAEEVGKEEEDKQQKIVLSFDGQEARLALNKTNAATLGEAFGKETSKWVGRELKLRKTKRNYNNQTVNAIDVEPVIEQ